MLACTLRQTRKTDVCLRHGDTALLALFVQTVKLCDVVLDTILEDTLVDVEMCMLRLAALDGAVGL